MAVTPDVIDEVRVALAEEPQVEHARIEVAAEGDVVVLRGAVPAPEQAATAATVAQAHAPAVDNRLRVDPHLREDETSADEVAGAAWDRPRPPRSERLTVQESSLDPEVVEEDLPSDAQSAMAENLPMDPPDAPYSAPTATEQFSGPERAQEVEQAADAGEEPEDEEPSAPDLSSSELRRRGERD